jgi:antitoxin VapB
MPLSIKDPETERLTRQVASLTGETLTKAIATALRERLDRLNQGHRLEDRFNQVRRIAQQFKSEIKEPIHSEDHGDLLYDENGFPK